MVARLTRGLRTNNRCDRSRSAEVHTLGERQLRRIVDGVGGAPHVGLPRIRTRLTAAARLLLAAECPADLGARGADVDVGDTAVRTVCGHEALGLTDVRGED